jgi:ABC-type nitrate/sulfonate/bicarbonate transport system ATPase subunit
MSTSINHQHLPDSAGQIALRVSNLSHTIETTDVLRNVTLSVEHGEFVTLVGPSGCGKSTLLNIIAGLAEPDHGDVWLDAAQDGQRLGRVAYMPQRDALLPWRSVIDNAILGLEIAGIHRGEARERATRLLPRFGLEGFGERYPDTLSGGMRQRAAFLRTVLTERELLLLDEPFGALDALTRRSMQEWLLELWADLGRTIVMVTHDVEEALLLSDHVAVMTARPGRIKLVEPVQLSRPRHPDMVSEPVFVEQKARLLSALRAEVALTARAGAMP